LDEVAYQAWEAGLTPLVVKFADISVGAELGGSSGPKPAKDKSPNCCSRSG